MKFRIATWNINSVRARIAIVEQFLQTYRPDVLCLQETKVSDDLFPAKAFKKLGYNHIAAKGQKSHHGVATISKFPLESIERLDWCGKGDARHVGVALPGGVRLENFYVPAGGDVPDAGANEKFAHKLQFFDEMIGWSDRISAPSILVG
ncbi:MAG: endonuclease/exonuclease/phosphatase family protein, partial [Pseudomonadota bacterium]